MAEDDEVKAKEITEIQKALEKVSVNPDELKTLSRHTADKLSTYKSKILKALKTDD
jgi:hypothetical protein